MGARESAVQALAWYYARDGYVRGPIPERFLREGWRRYKKGWEVRLSLSADEIHEVRHLIIRAGFFPAQPFWKHARLIQPVYGMAAVQEILAACGEDLPGVS